MVRIIGAESARNAFALAAVAASLGMLGRWLLGCTWWPVMIGGAIAGIAGIYVSKIDFRPDQASTDPGQLSRLLEKIKATDNNANVKTRIKQINWWLTIGFFAIGFASLGVERLLLAPACKMEQVSMQSGAVEANAPDRKSTPAG